MRTALAALLLAAMVSALVVVADQLLDSWADGHLLAAWMLMWVVGFAALALLAPTARTLARRMVGSLAGWSRAVARRRADARLWDLARKDARVMADIQAAAGWAESAESGAAADRAIETAVRVVNYQPSGRVSRLTRRIWNE